MQNNDMTGEAMMTTVRAMTENDLPRVVELNLDVHAMHVQFHPQLFHAVTPEDVAALFVNWLTAPDRRLLVAEIDSAVVGYCVLLVRNRGRNVFQSERQYLYLDQIGVDSKHRRRGVGAALVNRARSLADEMGISEIELDVYSANFDAERAFAALGFVECTRKMILANSPQ